MRRVREEIVAVLDPSLAIRSGWCVRSTAWLLGTALLAGCVAAEPPAPAAGTASGPPVRAATVPPRLVPIGRDPDGCMMYRVEAPGFTARALSYRTPGGRATFDRAAADCPDPRGDRNRSTTPAGDGRPAP